MIRRWLIRSFFIALCVICAGAWLGSRWRTVGLAQILRPGVRELPAAIVKDTFWIEWLDSWSGHWYVYFDNAMNPPQEGFLGFDVFKYGFMAPLWFPALLSAFLLWIIWRLTRRRKVSAAFPIEPTAAPK